MTKPTNRTITVGNVVSLNSGSQRMTITKIDNDIADVIWQIFDTKEFRTATLPVVALTKEHTGTTNNGKGPPW